MRFWLDSLCVRSTPCPWERWPLHRYAITFEPVSGIQAFHMNLSSSSMHILKGQCSQWLINYLTLQQAAMSGWHMHTVHARTCVMHACTCRVHACGMYMQLFYYQHLWGCAMKLTFELWYQTCMMPLPHYHLHYHFIPLFHPLLLSPPLSSSCPTIALVWFWLHHFQV